MGQAFELTLKVATIGIGATMVLDFWSLFLKRAFGIPFPSYPLVGRWIGHFPNGRFRHDSIAFATPVAGESCIGWATHYFIGIAYAGLLFVATGVAWMNAPTVLPALIVGVATVAAPFFVMQPAMGAGVASSKAPNPNLARLRSVAAHTAFGFGLYLSALLASYL